MTINIRIEQNQGSDKIHYAGPINEDAEVHLGSLLKGSAKKCTFNFKDVEYINSCGVRAWINFMRDFSKEREVSFEECTPEVVMQINMIPSFKGSAKVDSVFGSFACEKCGEKKSVLFENGKNLPTPDHMEVEKIKCPKCSSEMMMEELEDEYFAFTMVA